MSSQKVRTGKAIVSVMIRVRAPRRRALARLSWPAMPWLLAAVLAIGALPATPVHGATPVSAGFVENIGQLDERVIFSTSISGMAVFFTESGLVFDVIDRKARERQSPRQGSVVRINFQGDSRAPALTGRSGLPGILNFLTGPDPASWRTGVRRFSEIVYREVWPGIDLVFRIAPDGLRYDAIVRADADPSRIHFGYEGANVISESDGVEQIETSSGELVHRLPVPGEASGWIGRGDGDTSNPLAGDCSPIDWITFLGGADWDWGNAIAPDAAGRPIVAGVTNSFDFPTTSGAYSDSLTDGFDGFVTKLDASGTTLVWSTYIGGSRDDEPLSVNVDALGNVVISGVSNSADFPTTLGAYDETPSAPVDDLDVFVTKLSESGDLLLWSTYLGMDLEERVEDVVLDAEDNVLLCGHTYSPDFPTTPGAYRTDHPGGSVRDGFVVKLSSGGDALIWSTLLGADDDHEWIDAIDLDLAGNPVVGGAAFSASFPTTPGAYDESYNGEPDDGFLAKLSADGASLLWSTFVGGSNGDLVMDLEVDPSSGDVLTTGRTVSADFPTTPGVFDETHNGSRDNVVLRMSSDGTTLLWSTFLGGSGSDNVVGMAILPHGSVALVGSTNSEDFPTTENAFDLTYNGGPWDGFITFMSIDGTVTTWSTFVGGSGPLDDGFGGVDSESPVVVSGETVWVTGWSGSSDYPTCPSGVWDTTFEGDYDAVILKMAYSTVGAPEIVVGSGNRLMLASSPNPFRSGTTITYELPAAGPVQVTVHDVTGRLVRELSSSERMSAGSHRITWDGMSGIGSPVVPGVYFVQLETRDRRSSERIVRIR